MSQEPKPEPGRTAAPRQAEPSAAAPTPSRSAGGLDERLSGVEVPVTIVIGRKQVRLGDLGAWRGDTLIALDQSADAPLEVHVNGSCVATAELCEGDAGDGSLAIRILDVVNG